MAKDRQHPYKPSLQSITTTSNDDNGNRPKAQRDSEHRNRLGKEPFNSSLQVLCKLQGVKNIEYPIRVTDGTDRTWLLKDALSEPVECLGDAYDFTTDQYRSTLAGRHNAPSQTMSDDAGHWDPSGHDLAREAMSPRADQTTKASTRTKRLPGPLDCSPTKRRIYDSPTTNGVKSSNAVEEVGESDATDESDESEIGAEEDEFAGITFENQGVQISKIRGTMLDILKKLQQKGLKQVLKAMLRKCHPQKQANFPYNGGKLQEQKRINGDADYDEKNPGLLTAPDYWLHQDDWKPDHGHIPTGCRHREPDHIYKPERINLTMHLLHAGDRYNDAKFGLDKLRESTMNIAKDYPKEFQPDAERLIEALYYAREKELQYENGEIDANTVVYVPMPAQRPTRPKRTARNKKTATTMIKQDTFESSGVYELGTPTDLSPSINSSFRSNLSAVKVESESSSPRLSASAHLGTTGPNSHITMEQVASQASSYPSTSVSEGVNGAHSSENTPAPSEGDTEADTPDETEVPDQPIKPVKGQNLNLAADPGSQTAARSMTNHGPVVPTTTMHMASFGTPATSSFNHSITTQNHHSGGLCGMSAADQQVIEPVYFDTTDTYVDASGDHFINQSYASNMTNGAYATLTHNPADYVPFLQPATIHPMAPHPTPVTTHNMVSNALLTGYPSSASSDFNGAMPIDPDWHAVDFSYEHFHDGTYQQQQQRSLPLTTGPQQSSSVQRPDSGNDRRLCATEFDAMAHEPQRFTAQLQAGSEVQPAPQQMQQQQPLGSRYAYPFLQQQRGGRKE